MMERRMDEAVLERTGLFEGLQPRPADPLLAIIGEVRRDPRPHKIDLGVGVYRDASGATPILRAVKQAERILTERQETKAYLGGEGDVRFVELMKEMVFGAGAAAEPRIASLQTPGGCGALRLGAELINQARPGARVYVGQPTWPNHVPLLATAGLNLVEYPFYDVQRRAILFDRMIEALGQAEAGDLVLLHGCCHNPCGADLSQGQWREVADLVSRRGLIPFVDLAYQGLGNGLEPDAAGTRLVVAAAEQALVAHSNDKNFGVYRDRVGSLHVKGRDEGQARTIYSNLLVMARTMWSMPPDHGAAVVRIVLDTPALAADWHEELKSMCARIRALRARIGAYDDRLAYIADQNGMFSILPLGPDGVASLRAEEAIYMAGSGRFNVVGLSDANVERFAAAVVARLPETIHG
jgi:aspartate/tyrosine/aromatic aminotransferase